MTSETAIGPDRGDLAIRPLQAADYEAWLAGGGINEAPTPA